MTPNHTSQSPCYRNQNKFHVEHLSIQQIPAQIQNMRTDKSKLSEFVETVVTARHSVRKWMRFKIYSIVPIVFTGFGLLSSSVMRPSMLVLTISIEKIYEDVLVFVFMGRIVVLLKIDKMIIEYKQMSRHFHLWVENILSRTQVK